MLKVTVAEMDRTVIKQLGVNLNGSLKLGTSVVNFNNNNPFPVNGSLSSINPFAVNGSTVLGPLGQQTCSIAPCFPSGQPNSPAGLTSTFGSLTANLQAMEQMAWSAHWPSRPSPRSPVRLRISWPAAASRTQL
jgi:Flp pilus assembly secretin CpaC